MTETRAANGIQGGGAPRDGVSGGGIQGGDAAKEAGPQRQCFVTRRVAAKESLIRFVVGPDNRVLPDVAAKLPGRGIWLSAERDVVNTACERNLFAKGFRRAVEVDAQLSSQVEALVTKRSLEFLGLARRAGDVTLGFERVLDVVASGAAGVLIIAGDAADNGRRRLERAASGRPLVDLFSSSELAQALGREHAAYVVVAKGRNAARLVEEAGRLAGFRQAAPKLSREEAPRINDRAEMV